MFWVALSPVGVLENFTIDASVALILYRVIAHEWIWDSIKKKPPWALQLSANGWAFSGSGQNPLETLKLMTEDILTPKHKSIDEKIDKQLEDMIDKQTSKIIELMLNSPHVKKDMQKMIFDKVKARLETDVKKGGKK